MLCILDTTWKKYSIRRELNHLRDLNTRKSENTRVSGAVFDILIFRLET